MQRRWFWVLSGCLLGTPWACGGSASETPFPEEPLPVYVSPTTDEQATQSRPSGAGEPTGANPNERDGGVQASDPRPLPNAPQSTTLSPPQAPTSTDSDTGRP